MRLLTTVADQAEAKTLGDALYADGVVTTIKETRDRSFAIWVHDEDQMEQAHAFLNGFDPSSSRFSDMARKARAQRRQEAKADEQLRARTQKIREQIEAKQNMRVGTVTAGLMVICVAVFLLTGMGEKMDVVRFFTFTPLVPVRGGLRIRRRERDLARAALAIVYADVPALRLHAHLVQLVVAERPRHRDRTRILRALLARSSSS